ncbi:MAG: V-type ATP synthase subunit E family protein [Patescibacteria group bacterium]|nr:V-type ATP synthase subunit E family protein [Patescibacteria group bacterium]
MALDDIKKTILDQARKEADEIIRQGEKKADEIKAEWDKKVENRKEEIVASAQRKTNQKIQQTQFKIQAQSQTEILNYKQKIIDQVYQIALKELANLGDKDYIELMEKLIKQLPSGGGEILSVGNKEKLVKKALDKSGKKYDFSEKIAKGKGGFIFRSKKLEIDNTFATLVDHAKSQTILEVTGLLFGQKEE